MLPVEEALSRILADARLTGAETLPLDRCLGRVPVERVVIAEVDVPPFANSAMDGFALRATDAPGELRLVGESAAGAAVVPPVGPGSAVRILTGAPMPDGADAVAPLEVVTELDGSVVVPAVAPGAHVRAAAHDTRAGDRVELPNGPLTPSTIAVLASLGMGEVAVRRRPRVGVLSTGDELVPAGRPLGPGQVHDANGPALAAAVEEAGGEPGLMPAVGDDPRLIEEVIGAQARELDLLVVSGGVSVGRHDHVRGVLERLGRLELWRVRMQPGKPLAYGRIGDTPVLGLPGNPVSALVTFELFARTLVRAMLGLPGDGRERVPARVADRMPKDPERRAYLRVELVRYDGGFVARSTGGQSSSHLRPMAAANGLLVVPEGVPAAEAGETYDALVIGGIA